MSPALRWPLDNKQLFFRISSENFGVGDDELSERISETDQGSKDAVKNSTEGQPFSLTASLSETLEASCARPNETLAAAKRLIKSAMTSCSAERSDDTASCADLMLVRECGNQLVEAQVTLRAVALYFSYSIILLQSC